MYCKTFIVILAAQIYSLSDLPEPTAISDILDSSIIVKVSVVASLVMLVHIASNLLGRVSVPVSIMVVTSFVLGMVLAGAYAGDSWGNSMDSMDSRDSSCWHSFDSSYGGHFNYLDSSNSRSNSNLLVMKRMLRTSSIAIGCGVRGAAMVLWKEDTIHVDKEWTSCCTGKETAGNDLNNW